MHIKEKTMLDRSIPFYNTILKYDVYTPAKIILPQGYALRFYRPGDENAWASLHCETGDFADRTEARDYFVKTYCESLTDIRSRCVFAVNPEGKIVGSCTAWQDKRGDRTVSSLHWLVVTPEEQGKGLGKALCHKVMHVFADHAAFPVYIHTQPWSYAAILLYIRLGFKLQKTDSFSHYTNQYAEAMATLENLLTVDQYQELMKNSID